LGVKLSIRLARGSLRVIGKQIYPSLTIIFTQWAGDSSTTEHAFVDAIQEYLDFWNVEVDFELIQNKDEIQLVEHKLGFKGIKAVLDADSIAFGDLPWFLTLRHREWG
jgi:hypothetical protein